VVSKAGVIAVPAAVEVHSPETFARETNVVAVVSPIRHVRDDDDAVTWATMLPPMKRYHFVIVVNVVNVYVLSAKPTRVTPIAARRAFQWRRSDFLVGRPVDR